MSPAKQDTTPVAYSRAKYDLNTGDIVLFRARPWRLDPRSWKGALVGSLITWFGRSDYSHAGMLVACLGEWYVAEQVEGYGGRLQPLAMYAATHSGEIDVFRPVDPNYDGVKAAKSMLRAVGTPYGYRVILKAFAMHLPGVRHFAKSVARNKPWAGPFSCSGEISRAMDEGGSDPVGDLPHEHTEPGDLARSPIINRGYLFTIVADPVSDGPIGVFAPE
jgi:hypothetical protein